MGNMITVSEKKDFLKWFLHSYQLKQRECVWLLNYLISDDALMEKLHFVERAEYCPKAIIISTTEVDRIPFSFHKRHHVTMDVEKAFHDIRLNADDDIYIQLYFQGASANPHYALVLEENPYLPKDKMLTSADSVLAEMILDKALLSFSKKELAKEIDKALDEKDEWRFQKLVKKMHELQAFD